MTIDEVYKLVLYSTAKNSSQGYVSPSDFNLAINQAQKSYVAYLLGSFQQYLPGRPIARVQFGQNTTIRTRLAPIIYWTDLTVDGDGLCPYPEDYLQTDAMFTAVGYNRIRVVQQDHLYSYYNSAIDWPLINNPFYILEDTGFHFFPEDIGAAKLSYVANPPDMTWAYTVGTGNIPQYSETGGPSVTPTTGSAQPVWDDASILEIIVRALAIIGVNLQLQTVEQYSMAIKNQGQ
jgi:hypothetical protein